MVFINEILRSRCEGYRQDVEHLLWEEGFWMTEGIRIVEGWNV